MASASSASSEEDQRFAERCGKLRQLYGALGRREWWWIQEESLETIGLHLQRQGYVVLDGFLLEDQAEALRNEVLSAHAAGRLEASGLVDGSVQGREEATYRNAATRGDLVGWFAADGESWPHGRGLESYLRKVATLVTEIANYAPELKRITTRSQAMVACYPGDGARYVKHVDNDGKHALCNKRVLTALIYLNAGWVNGDGGEIAIYDQEEQYKERRVVEPLCNRVLLFWSDARTPHEVRPACKSRYAITVWMLDNTVVPHPSAGHVNGDDVVQKSAADESCKAVAEANQSDSELEISADVSCRYEWKWCGSACDDVTQISRLGAWELRVELMPEAAATECPAIEASDKQVRIIAANGDALLCLPLPFESPAAPVPKWSRKRRLLTVLFEPDASSQSSANALRSMEEASANVLVEQLRSRGWGSQDGFLPGVEADALRRCVFALRKAGKLSLGRNKHEGSVESGRVKNDEYAFVEAAEDPELAPLRRCLARCNRLLARLVASRQIGALSGVELVQGRPMVAVYPGDGSHYGRHLDATSSGAGDNGRVLTLVIYLNPCWRESHGGCLRILESLDDTVGSDVEPLHGRAVAFLCRDRCPHEVLPAWADRAAVTVWYYDGSRLSDRCRTGADISGYGFEAD
eukprot:TRINITY_DN7618_c1_g1_i1.p1 TRINITY_DN7618_c1_g1~~TRINITY_DN7618_c1_g1_i1.p1  ORF type:complete len:691 (+),score=135.88 TRINITY_DN7618_c1_g1_i1:158-2074(+)